MAYNPKDQIDVLEFTCPYTPPQGGSIEFRLAEIGQVCEIGIPWEPQSGSSIVLNLSRKASGVTSFNFSWGNCCPGSGSGDGGGTVDPPVVESLVPNMTSDFRVSWRGGKGEERKDNECTVLFKDAKSIHLETKIKWVKVKLNSDSDVLVSWGTIPAKDKDLMLRHSQFNNYYDNDTSFAFFGIVPTKDRSVSACWDDIDLKDIRLDLPWSNPPAKDVKNNVLWGDAEHKVDDEVEFPWETGVPRDKDQVVKWGKLNYEEICYRDYVAPSSSGIELNFETRIEDVDDGTNIATYFDALTYDPRCDHRESSGSRDAYNYEPPDVDLWEPFKKVFTIMNNALLTRVSDSAPIDVRTMSMGIDVDSWCWSFKATIGSKEALEKCVDLSTPVEVEAYINGYEWRFIVEKWTESVSFGRSGYTISGRSTSALLAAPYSPPSDYIATAPATSLQLAEVNLENTGYTIEWSLPDWLIPSDTYSYTDKTRLKAIQQLIQPVGGVLQSSKDGKTLKAIPRYTALPWNMAAATTTMTVPGAILKQIGREWKPEPEYNAVFVSGTSKGVSCKVIREGSAGDKSGQMIADKLITATEAARERGSVELAKGGKWSLEKLSLPLTPSPDLPGLLEVGQLITISQSGKTPYKGQIVAVSVDANRQRGLKVNQEVTLERYHA